MHDTLQDILKRSISRGRILASASDRRAVRSDLAAVLGKAALNTGTGLAGCAAAGVEVRDGRFSYSIVCPGRDGSRAAARYRLEPQGFRGRIAIVMGAKNMTMTEVQVARRLGACGPAAGR